MDVYRSDCSEYASLLVHKIFDKLKPMYQATKTHCKPKSQRRMKVKIENTFIKGYHVYRVRPHAEIAMIVKPEEVNDLDDNAMGIWMPPLTDIPVSYHYSITRPAKNYAAAQRVIDIAGMFVGRVPANFGKVFRTHLTHMDKIVW